MNKPIMISTKLLTVPLYVSNDSDNTHRVCVCVGVSESKSMTAASGGESHSLGQW